MTAAASVLPPKIERTPMRLWLVRGVDGQPVYCGSDASLAQRTRAGLMPCPVEPELPAVPLHPYGDSGPRSIARGELELAEITFDYCGGRGPNMVTTEKVVRRKSQGMQCLNEGQRRTLETYASRVEALESISTVPLDGGKGGTGSVDVGKYERAVRAIKLRKTRETLSRVTIPITTRGQGDRPPGKPITFLALVDGVAIWRRSLCEILSDHGWPRTERAKRKLGRALRRAADALAEQKGID